MKRRHLFSVIILAVAVVLGSGFSSHPLLGETEAAWTDSEYVTGPISTGSWTTSGYGRGAGGLGLSSGGIVIDLFGSSMFEGVSQQNTIGKDLDTTNLVVAKLLGVNSLSRTGSISSCAAYSVGQPASGRCQSAIVSDTDATSTLTSMTVTVNLLSLLGVDLVSAPIVTVASPITAGAACDTSNRASVSASSPTNQVTVGSRVLTIPQPAENASVTVTGADATVNAAGLATIQYTNIKLVSTRTSTATTAQSTLSVSLSMAAFAILGAQILGTTNVTFNLVTAQCGIGSATYPVTPLSLPTGFAARAVSPTSTSVSEPPSSTTSSTTAAETTAAETTAGMTTTASVPTPTATPTSTATPTTTAAPTTSTPAPPDPIGTAIHGPADSSISAFTTDDGLTCDVAPDADYTSEVAVECSDGTTGTVPGSELGPKPTAPGEYLRIPLTRDHVTEVFTLKSATRR